MVTSPLPPAPRRFLAGILTACDHWDHPDLQNLEVVVVSTDGRKVTAKLVAPSGDAYRVTVEWLSEESP